VTSCTYIYLQFSRHLDLGLENLKFYPFLFLSISFEVVMIDELNMLTLLYIVTFLLRDLFHEQATLFLYERNKSALCVRNIEKSREN